jgi:magnesium transporter
MIDDDPTVVTTLVDDYIRLFPDDLTREMERLPIHELARFLAARPTEQGAALLGRLRTDIAADTIVELDEETRRRLLPAVDPARAAAALARLGDPVLGDLLQAIDESASRELRELMSYPRDTAGAIMDARVTMMRDEATADEALQRLRVLRDRRVYNMYVVDGDGVYLGRVPLQDIAIAEPDQPLRSLISEPAVSVRATASQTEVVELLEAHRILALPVVDFEGRLLGSIRHQSLVEAVAQEATADIQSMVGASREERALSPVLFAVRKRLPWLEVNLVTAFLAAAVVGLFEGTIARFTALAVLLPVVAGQSGNTGAQALAVTLRGLALREVRVRHWLRVASKEIRVATLNGVAVALTTSAAVYLWSRSPGLTLVIGVSMVLSMAAAGLSGAAIPMLLTAIHQDPAQSSSIILTTVTDVVGFLSFLGIATLLAGML